MTATMRPSVEESMLRIRNPLARIALASSRLVRDAMTPTTRAFASSISDAVREIDEEIDEALADLQNRPIPMGDQKDCHEVLTALRDRMLPILQTYQIEWPEPEIGGDVVLGDRNLVELATLAMLRTGIAIANQSEHLKLSLVHEPNSLEVGLRLTTSQRSSSADLDEADDDILPGALEPARAFARRYRCSLDYQQEGDTVELTLWIRSGGAS